MHDDSDESDDIEDEDGDGINDEDDDGVDDNDEDDDDNDEDDDDPPEWSELWNYDKEKDIPPVYVIVLGG